MSLGVLVSRFIKPLRRLHKRADRMAVVKAVK